MTTQKKIGIWMDHSRANLMEVSESIVVTKSIDSAFTHEVKQQSLSKGEHLMHNKEQQQHSAYYKRIAEEILAYDQVLLFGPTNAKNELLNMLQSNLAFKEIAIAVVDADKMTDNQQQAFVREHFTNL